MSGDVGGLSQVDGEPRGAPARGREERGQIGVPGRKDSRINTSETKMKTDWRGKGHKNETEEDVSDHLAPKAQHLTAL